MWQGTRLLGNRGHGYALLGTTMTPGFRRDQFRLAARSDLDVMPRPVAARLAPYLAPGM